MKKIFLLSIILLSSVVCAAPKKGLAELKEELFQLEGTIYYEKYSRIQTHCVKQLPSSWPS